MRWWRRWIVDAALQMLIFVLPGLLDALESPWDRLMASQLDASTRRDGALSQRPIQEFSS